MAWYVVTYTPLASSREGREAAENHGHPLFADASCRREPDFEAVYPSISCVCRGSNFAPRLTHGDTVVYLTKKGSYQGLTEPHWRLVAILKVFEVFRTHSEAATWHRERGLPLPSDCIVPGNPPLPLDHTEGPDEDLAKWDATYQARTTKNGTLVLCKPLWMDLFAPPIVRLKDLLDVFGRIPPTRNPPAVPEADVQKLLAMVGVKPDGSHVRRPESPIRPKGRSIPNATPVSTGTGAGRGCRDVTPKIRKSRSGCTPR
jgi:hypothetical protein